MLNTKLPFPALLVSLILICSCSLNESAEAQSESPKQDTEEAEATAVNYVEPHPYGGWYCPDNLTGLPPMDIQEYKELEVIADRLPTEQETWDGKALIYVDTDKYPNARALDIDLPRVGRIYSGHNLMNELIIVFQAIVVDNDTVVGYRFPSGGNGSAWLGEVSFLTDEEVKDLGPMPMVFLESDIKASKEEIWEAFTQTEFATSLGERFQKEAFFKSEWDQMSQSELHFKTDDSFAYGIAANAWGNIYMHIDYDYDGFHYSEKMLIMEDEEAGTTSVQFVAGPYPADIESQQVIWENWMAQVTRLTEGE
jgi:hypothetical protein